MKVCIGLYITFWLLLPDYISCAFQLIICFHFPSHFVFVSQKEEVFLNLVLEYVPETVYRVARHYSKNKQTIPILYVKVCTKATSINVLHAWYSVFSSFVSLYMCDCRVQLTQKGEVFLNLVMEFVPEMLYRIARHYSKSKQTIPLIYIKVGVTGWWHYFSFLDLFYLYLER